MSTAAQQGYTWLTDRTASNLLQVEATSYTTGDMIVPDAGHGGYDTGNISHDGAYEKDITPAITQKIGEQLEKTGYTVVYIRTSDEVSWSNDNRDDSRTRVAIGEGVGTDCYISMHTSANEYGDGASGFEAYADYENDTITAMAQSIRRKLIQLGYVQNRGLKSTQDSSLYVASSSPVPAMLPELGSITDSVDAAYMCSEGGRNVLIQSITQGILEQFQLSHLFQVIIRAWGEYSAEKNIFYTDIQGNNLSHELE